MTIPAFPLSWPQGWKRTPASARACGRFGTRGKHEQYSWTTKNEITIAGAVDRIRQELGRMRIRDDDLVISTNLQLRLDGFPRSGQPQPADPGVAVYWRDGRETRCMAIDRYTKVEHNLAAVAATLDAMRAIERHGGAAILDRAFIGFAALPGPAALNWRDIFGYAPHATPSAMLLEQHYRRERAAAHPDRGGSAEAFDRVERAYRQAREELGFN